MGIPRRLLVIAVAKRLATVTNATGYFGQIGSMHGLPGVEATPADPPAKSATDLRVRPYFVLEPGAGDHNDDEASVAGHTDTATDLDMPLTVRVAGGDIEDVLALIDRVDALLFGWAPVVDGVQCGPLAPPAGYTAPLLPDRGVTPERFFSPLQYAFRAFT